jgi:RimJ/RimL family protein N-acetyltransferase
VDYLFQTERLAARAFTIDDVAAAFEMYGDPEVMRYLMGGTVVPDLEAQRAWLEQRIARFQAMPAGFGAWALVEKASSRVVGTVIHRRIEGPASVEPGDVDPDVEIGWHLQRRVWGRGYATEAGRALLAHGHERLGLPRLVALIEPDNARSIAVARRIGMADAGRTTTYYDGMELCLWESLHPLAQPPLARTSVT